MLIWETIAHTHDDQLCLAEAALLLARDEYPELDTAAYLEQLDHWASELRPQLDPTREDAIDRLNRFLFKETGFSGNQANYYDPRNSYLNEVMDRRLGIPVTLAIIYMEVAARLGIEMSGVNFPGHFLVKCRINGHEMILDPHTQGARLDELDLNRLLRRTYGEDAPTVRDQPELINAISKRGMIVRVLRNLKVIYLEIGYDELALTVLNRILTLAPYSTIELRERADVLTNLECYQGAQEDLERFRRHTRNADTDREFTRSLRRLEAERPSYH